MKQGINNQLDINRVVKMSKRKLKKKFGVKYSDKEIKGVINNWIENIKSKAVQGKKVNIDKHSFIQVTGRPVLSVPSAVRMISEGRYRTRSGFVKKADNMNFNRNDFVYKIEYHNKLANGKHLIFTPTDKFSKMVNEALKNTNTYFHLNVN